MASVRAVRRRLLREAVEENYAAIFGTPAPSVRRRRRLLRLRRFGIWSVVLTAVFAGSWGLAQAAQLDGEIKLTRSPGTTFEITFFEKAEN